MQVEFICGKCKKDGLIECEHLRDLQPAHLSEDSDMSKLLIPGDKLFNQEILGLIMEGNDGKIFKTQYIDFLLKRNRIKNISSTIDEAHLYTWIDPKGTSSEASYLAIVTLCITKNDSVIIIGADECQSAAATDQIPFVRNYFASIAQDTDMAYLPHTLFVENNFCGIGSVSIRTIYTLK